ncbi:MAG: hypothetical protein ACI8VT_003041 [Saprospiraceae bacterium]|jgi:hypothetical protein
MGVLIVCGLPVRQMCLTRQFFSTHKANSFDTLYQASANARKDKTRFVLIEKTKTLQGVKNNGCSHSVWAARQANASDEAAFFLTFLQFAVLSFNKLSSLPRNITAGKNIKAFTNKKA